MDRFVYSGPKPQFNVVFFNRKLHLQTNEKFCTELIKFIFADEQFTESFGYLGDDLKTVLNKISSVVNDDDNNPVVIKTGETVLIALWHSGNDCLPSQKVMNLNQNLGKLSSNGGSSDEPTQS